VAALLALPLLSWVLMANVAHDAAHFAFSSSPALNEALALVSCPLLYNTGFWYLQHDVSHHVHTNDAERDADLGHFAPLARLHAGDRWRPAHAAGVAWVASGFAFATIAECLVFPFVVHLRRRELGETGPVARRTRAASAAQVIVSLGVLALPFARFAAPKAALFALFPYVGVSLLFMSLTQLSHVQARLQERPPGDGHWALRQVAASLDYAQDSRLAAFLTGGLNMQGLHHCVPFMSCSRYHAFYPEYRRICAKHGVAIQEVATFGEAFASMWAHVADLTRPREGEKGD
jgi:fatty acid desaturase